MCVYLTPRWRRRLFVLALTLTQLLLTADPRTLRKLNVRHKTEHPDSELTSVGENIDSEVTSVGNITDSDTNVGVVATKLTSSLTTVTDKAWNSGSNRDESRQSTDKSVSFNNLVKSTPSTSLKHLELLASKRPVSMDCIPCVTTGKMNTSNLRQGDEDNEDIDASFDKGSNNADADISSDIKLTNDETTIQMGTTNKAANFELVLPTARNPAPMADAPPSPPLMVGSFDHRTQKYPSSNSSASSGMEPNSTDRPEVLENETKSSFSTAANRSLDQTLVVMIIGVVGAIGTLVMFVSRRVLKETQDDDLDLEDSRFF